MRLAECGDLKQMSYAMIEDIVTLENARASYRRSPQGMWQLRPEYRDCRFLLLAAWAFLSTFHGSDT